VGPLSALGRLCAFAQAINNGGPDQQARPGEPAHFAWGGLCGHYRHRDAKDCRQGGAQRGGLYRWGDPGHQPTAGARQLWQERGRQERWWLQLRLCLRLRWLRLRLRGWGEMTILEGMNKGESHVNLCLLRNIESSSTPYPC